MNDRVNGHQLMVDTIVKTGAKKQSTKMPQIEIPFRKNQPINKPANQNIPKNTIVSVFTAISLIWCQIQFESIAHYIERVLF